jgi:2-methylisocitrate lyase-like PEP mutase family enzyme
LYAPGLRDLGDIRAVCDAVTRPVNVIMGLPGLTFSISDLAAAGVARISVGSAFARLVYGKLIAAASEIRDIGTFSFADEAAGFDEIERYFR